MNKGLSIERFDHLVLMATSQQLTSIPAIEIQKEFPEYMLRSRGYSLADPNKPLRIEIELGEGWPSRIGSKPLALKMIFSSQPIKSQGRYPGPQRLEETVRAGATPWQGLLCTPAIHINLPAIAKPKPAQQSPAK